MIEAPYLHLDDFLDEDEHAKLLEFVRGNDAELVTSSVNPAAESGHAIDDEYRRSRVLHELGPIMSMFSTRLHALLPHVRSTIGLPWFAIDRLEAQLTAHGDGDFFGVHTDRGGPDVSTRTVTYVYDNVERDGYYHPAEQYATIEPRDNNIVFLLSTIFHEVMPVHTRGADLEHQRFTVNGWFHCAKAEPAEASALDADDS